MHANAFDLLYLPQMPHTVLGFVIIVAVWTILLKGFALWYAARNHQRAWFIILLIVNTLGLLDIAYLIWFRPDDKKQNETHHSHGEKEHGEKSEK